MCVCGCVAGPLFSSPDVVFRGDHWVRVTSSAGRSLLHLDDNYRVLSLGTLSIRTTHVTITVSDVPEGCLMERSEEDRKRSIRILLLNSSSTNSGVYVTGADKLVEVCYIFPLFWGSYRYLTFYLLTTILINYALI